MNPDKINKIMNSQLGVDDEISDEEVKKFNFFFKLGTFIAAAVFITLAWTAWNIVLPKFGVPKLGFLEFGCLAYLLLFLRRIWK